MEICKTNNWLRNNGFSEKEEEQIYEDNLQDVFENPRMWLDNLESIPEYRVSWKNYNTEKDTATLPKRYIKQKSL